MRFLRLALSLVACTTMALSAEGDGPPALETCVRSQGYWSTHPAEWPVTSLVLGNPQNPAHTYSKSELLELLRGSVRGDASRSLATQLIAAKLNVSAGARPEPVLTQLARGDQLLSAFIGRLPLRHRNDDRRVRVRRIRQPGAEHWFH